MTATFFIINKIRQFVCCFAILDRKPFDVRKSPNGFVTYWVCHQMSLTRFQERHVRFRSRNFVVFVAYAFLAEVSVVDCCYGDDDEESEQKPSATQNNMQTILSYTACIGQQILETIGSG